MKFIPFKCRVVWVYEIMEQTLPQSKYKALSSCKKLSYAPLLINLFYPPTDMILVSVFLPFPECYINGIKLQPIFCVLHWSIAKWFEIHLCNWIHQEFIPSQCWGALYSWLYNNFIIYPLVDRPWVVSYKQQMDIHIQIKFFCMKMCFVTLEQVP